MVVSGGAIFLVGNGVGPRMTDLSFISNSDLTGSGTYVVGNDNAITTGDNYAVEHSTTYLRCSFVGNVAHVSGGAVHSVTAADDFFDPSFEYNSARVGGALRLAGSVSIFFCSSIKNVSEEK